jgi:signal transduction histidine kinase
MGDTLIQATASPIIGEDAVRLGAVAVFRDVTEQRTLERQKDAFLSAAAHDLKTPLTTIKGLAQILQRRARRSDTPETNAMIDGLSRIDTTTTRMTALINELLDVTRLQMGRSLDLVLQPIDLVAFAERLISEQQQTTENHRLVVESEVDQLVGRWDEARLERAITNLLANATTYSPNGGTVTVRVRQDQVGDQAVAVLTVSDQGLGIPEADLPYIFERFHRASNVAGTIPGTGIGLAGASQIIAQHGGEISVESTVGQGTTFTVCLPLRTEQEAMAETETRGTILET